MFEAIDKARKYCSSLTQYKRYKTREVHVGDIALGGNNPIRIQSMTTTNTMDTIATVEQTIRMVNAGCEYVRITAPSKLEAQNLEAIKKELKVRGYEVPLIADIHFTPNAAELAARIVEKVRVNPGNYADKKKFETIEYDNGTYEAELERIRKKFTPLVKICKEYGTAMRIGTNHGSLSDRIMSRYGDTPLGMVESALEFLRICEDLNYYNIVLSMKASNPKVMVQAYRLLVNKMEEENMKYPLHLGVTEAGGGEDGRVKSALGIGTLLEDGLGDTIRVSLTEDPEFEAPAAISLRDRYINRSGHKTIPPVEDPPFNPFVYEKRKTIEINGTGGSNLPRVVSDMSGRGILRTEDLKTIGYSYDAETDKWNMSDTAPDILYLGTNRLQFDAPTSLKAVYDYNVWKSDRTTGYPLINAALYMDGAEISDEMNFIEAGIDDFTLGFTEKISTDKTAVIVLTTCNMHGMPEQRRVFFELLQNDAENPVIIKRSYTGLTEDELRLYSSTDIGGLLIDGYGDGVWLNAEIRKEDEKAEKVLVRRFVDTRQKKETMENRLLFNILQAARVRISKTEYIACPSCGRTLFDLQETTDMIRQRTEHLKGVKIAIMGCIVNGPGEMADADYGYVGSGPGKITLYRGKDIVKRNIPSAEAVNQLIDLISEDGNWIAAPAE